MKIIKRGDQTPWWVGKMATCPQCATIVELEANDVITEDEVYVLGIFREELVTVPCPVCTAKIALSHSDTADGIPTMRARFI